MDIFNLCILFLGGMLGGFYGAAIGGGALLTLPLLLWTGMPIHLALGTQRFAAIILELTSAVKFHKAGKLNWKLGIFLSIFGVVGAVTGVHVAVNISERALNSIVGIMLLIAAVVLFNKDRFGIKEHPLKNHHLVWLSVSMFLFGIYSGFFGAGSALFSVLILMVFGFPFMEGAGMARLIGTFVSIAGAVVFAQYGLINYDYGLVLGGGFAVGSWMGLHVAFKKDEGYVKKLVFVVVLLTFVKLIPGIIGIKIY